MNCHFKTIEKLAMERLIRSDEQLVSLLRSRRSNVFSRPFVRRQFDDVISGTRGVVLRGWLKRDQINLG